MVKRETYLSGTKWEPIVGYSRAIKVNNFIYVSGTTATDENGKLLGGNDPYLQTVQAILNIEKALSHFNSSIANIVRTRMFVTNIDQWELIAKAHGEFFKEIQPVTTMVEVKRLINPDMLIEIEADAVIEK